MLVKYFSEFCIVYFNQEHNVFAMTEMALSCQSAECWHMGTTPVSVRLSVHHSVMCWPSEVGNTCSLECSCFKIIHCTSCAVVFSWIPRMHWHFFTSCFYTMINQCRRIVELLGFFIGWGVALNEMYSTTLPCSCQDKMAEIESHATENTLVTPEYCKTCFFFVFWYSHLFVSSCIGTKGCRFCYHISLLNMHAVLHWLAVSKLFQWSTWVFNSVAWRVGEPFWFYNTWNLPPDLWHIN